MNSFKKKEKLVIGIMSGTSADGVDAALLRIRGCGFETKMQQLAYVSVPFEDDARERILKIAAGDFGGSAEMCRMNRFLGDLYLGACLKVCDEAGIEPEAVDLVGCHGQTVYHEPTLTDYLGHKITSTYQIGDPSILCERLDCVAVSDFRVRDMAAGGGGAPLVPYTEFLLYHDDKKNIALQNIGGMGNITFIPAGACLDDVTAFDTGPGNVLIDAAIGRYSNGKLRFDEGGKTAEKGLVSKELMSWLMETDTYIMQEPPKSTGREHYNKEFLDRIYTRAGEMSLNETDIIATLTAYTAHTIAYSVKHFLSGRPDRLIVGGGGSYNKTLLAFLKEELQDTDVMINEDLGFSSDAKEAVAFAILANETVHGIPSNVPHATKARHPVILGKITQ